MTKQEIKTIIEKGITGQGTNVDGGGYLPKILDAIVELLPDGIIENEIKVPNDTSFSEPLNSIISQLRQAVADGVILKTSIVSEDGTKRVRIISYGPLNPGESFYVHAFVTSGQVVLVRTIDD